MTPSATDRDIELGQMPPADLGDELEPPVPRPGARNQNCWGRCCGRVIKDWSQVVGGVGATGGVVGGGVGFAMEDYRVILVAAAVIFVSFGLLCARISCLKPQKELEDQVAYFSSEVDRLGRNEERLKRAKAELEGVLGEAQASIKELGRTLQVPVDRIEGVAEKIGAVEAKLQVLVDLYHRYKAATQAVSQDLKIFKESQKVTKESISRLGQGLQRLDVADGALSDEVDEYQDAGEFHREQNAELRRMLSGFKSDFVLMQKKFVLMRGELEELRQHVLKLDVADDKFRDGGEDFKSGVDDARLELLPKLQEMVGRLDSALEELQQDTDTASVIDDDDSELVSVLVVPSDHHAASSSNSSVVVGRDVIDARRESDDDGSD